MQFFYWQKKWTKKKHKWLRLNRYYSIQSLYVRESNKNKISTKCETMLRFSISNFLENIFVWIWGERLQHRQLYTTPSSMRFRRIYSLLFLYSFSSQWNYIELPFKFTSIKIDRMHFRTSMLTQMYHLKTKSLWHVSIKCLHSTRNLDICTW